MTLQLNCFISPLAFRVTEAVTIASSGTGWASSPESSAFISALTLDRSSSTMNGQLSQQSESGKVSVCVLPGSERPRMYRQGAGSSSGS